MIDMLDSGWLRVVAYGVTALLAIVVGTLEHRSPLRTTLLWWPTFWFMSSTLIAAMGLARLGEVGDLIAVVGRDSARTHGWYDQRRNVQAGIVIVVASAWVIAVLAALWRVPSRRRRYLPTALTLFTLVCFAVIRAVSLHQVDSVLYRRNLHGVRWVAIIELLLLGIASIAIAVRVPRHPIAGSGKITRSRGTMLRRPIRHTGPHVQPDA